ncbi:MAG: inositol monophosphatase [Proteobacteria bacterium]|nr:inositol monophosphatase [Pseudomonadota bacterium]MCP4921286.1 inositol monophosphatase [Pseudomonadota bacterium]
MIALAKEAALAAGELLHDPPRLDVRHKGAVDLVTQIDLACEDAIRAVLSRSGIDILGEEGGGSRGLTRWIVDPLDGTTNFVHGFPSYCVSIALLVDGVLEVGVIYDPVHRRLFEATKGGGARCNGDAIRVSERDQLSQSLVASGFAYDRRERADDYLRFVKVFLERAQGFRRAGAAAMDLAMVATGQLDGFWEFGLNAWDVAAGALLVQEAGGSVTDMEGGALDLDRPRLLATNGRIHGEMTQAIGPLLPL